MAHTLKYHAGKAKAVLDDLNAKRDEALKRDRELSELFADIDALKGQLAEVESAAADDGHSVADLHEAAGNSQDEAGAEPDDPGSV